ncbi:type II/IV secretion system protein [candidate division KSB1 bacterium]|nr:MAG: type II/IV secretion system protein [candidate division KSB1 bacterium]
MKALTRIGERLIKKGIVSEETVQIALRIQEKEPPEKRRKLGEILINDFSVDRHLVYREIASIYAFREVDLSKDEMDDKCLKFISEVLSGLPKDKRSIVLKKKIIPYKLLDEKKNTLIFLTPDPTDREIPEIAMYFGYKRYEIAYCRMEQLDELIKKITPVENEYLELLQEITPEVQSVEEEEEFQEEALDAEINQSLLVNLVEGCLVEAVRRGASDIHIMPRDKSTTDILFRIDGKLQLWLRQENTKPEAIAAVFKDRSKNVNRFEREKAQDGFIQRKVDDYLIRYRVSILPIVGSEYQRRFESIVIRILDDRKVITDLNKLGFQKKAKEDFLKAIKKPSGIVILTGPTGSGKSTTLMAALHHVIDPTLNVITIEEPVEYLIRGARQLKIGEKMNFDQALRCILRHDPDIVMVGEIRDLKTAEIAIKLANTGHLTFSTLHTNDAASAVSRLYKMGIEPFLIAYAINIVVAQRLVRTICNNCKEEVKNINPNIPLSLGFTDEEIENTTFYRGAGCEKCNYSGYKGRVAIHEALYFHKEIRQVILSSNSQINEEAIKDLAIKEGMLTLRASGRERIKEGITTCDEVAFVTAED